MKLSRTLLLEAEHDPPDDWLRALGHPELPVRLLAGEREVLDRDPALRRRADRETPPHLRECPRRHVLVQEQGEWRGEPEALLHGVEEVLEPRRSRPAGIDVLADVEQCVGLPVVPGARRALLPVEADPQPVRPADRGLDPAGVLDPLPGGERGVARDLGDEREALRRRDALERRLEQLGCLRLDRRGRRARLRLRRERLLRARHGERCEAGGEAEPRKASPQLHSLSFLVPPARNPLRCDPGAAGKHREPKVSRAGPLSSADSGACPNPLFPPGPSVGPS